MKTILAAILFLTTLYSCKIGPNNISNRNYNNKEIGWTMSIPKGWSLTD